MPRRLILSTAMALTGAALLATSAVAGRADTESPQAWAKAPVGGTFKHSLTVDIDYIDPAL
ncbi:MAG TPA: hypothetical protein VFO03_05450, partial [Gaiellaceae bacterium]|nr:hypothetical protein [Gaiellaceae bacterium]